MGQLREFLSAGLHMPETTRELLLQSNAIEQRLKQDQTGEGGQALILEADFWDTMSLAVNAGFATLHANGLRWFIGLVWHLQFHQLRDRFFIAGSHFIASVFGVGVGLAGIIDFLRGQTFGGVAFLGWGIFFWAFTYVVALAPIAKGRTGRRGLHCLFSAGTFCFGRFLRC